jgi:hypothetical protein
MKPPAISKKNLQQQIDALARMTKPAPPVIARINFRS